jgi:methyltransferase (TIGR00027 family)
MISSVDYQKVGRTAFVIAQWRCEETEQPNPLFCDHVANVFLNEETTRSAKAIVTASSATRFLVRYRTKFFDDQIRARIAAGVGQFVILGSGLDTRSIRLVANGAPVRFFEVDQQPVLEYKREALEGAGYDVESTLIHAEYTSVEFMSALESKGLDLGKSTFVLWEGNTMYLEYESLLAVLRTLRTKLARVEIAFDYVSKKLIANATVFRTSQRLLESFGSMGAQWRTGIDSAAEVAREVGLDCGMDFLLADYVNSLGTEIEVDRTLFDDYRIGTLSQGLAR